MERTITALRKIHLLRPILNMENHRITLISSSKSTAHLPPTTYQVIVDKAEILNESFESRSPPNYYIKGDSFDAFDQNEDWVQVSYKNGAKFGWIDKRDLKPASD